MKRARCGRDFSANQADAYGYASAGEARPNAVSQVRLANGSLRRYGYDASGNLVCQTDDGQSGSCDQWPQFEAYYNHNQQPSYQRRKASGSGATAQYAESWYSYGADQQPARQWGIERIEGCTLDSLGCLRHHRIYLDRYEDSVGTLRHIDGRARQARTRAYIGDYLVATRGDAGQLELSYLLRDRLGSVVGVEQVTLSDRRISGLTPETRHAFDAFGAPRSNRWWSANRWHDIGIWYSPTRTRQGFTGHERLSGLQLIHMRGRVFDSVLGRFHGVDPIIQFPLSSQGLNPYSYILNNPMAGVDPTGYAVCVTKDECTISTSEVEEIEINQKTGEVTLVVGTGDNAERYRVHSGQESKAILGFLQSNGAMIQGLQGGGLSGQASDIESISRSDATLARVLVTPAPKLRGDPYAGAFLSGTNSLSLGLVGLFMNEQNKSDLAAYEEKVGSWPLLLSLTNPRDFLRSIQKWGAKDGPGQFGRVIESMKDRAALYQSRMVGRLPDVGYIVGGVKFDGFDVARGVLLDAKGPGYANFVRNGRFRSFFRGADELANQAERQIGAARGTPIEWHFAEEAAANATRNLLRDRDIKGISIIHSP